ncbi:hypothetical protein CHS0354_007277 [Potamilus streckersoni]|uniref:Uncharacterized protein n=1 Tax=Potamilus streckersoni TaxID=2493646 RepID=A0AAE0WC91_9BIVA|nr:hypothetical protein CHS0354_007277 [Potamilus streckersoni]
MPIGRDDAEFVRNIGASSEGFRASLLVTLSQRSTGLDHLPFSTRSALYQRSSGLDYLQFSTRLDPPSKVVRARSLTVFYKIRPSIKGRQGWITYRFLQDQALYQRSSGLDHLQFSTRSGPLSKVVRARSLTVFYPIRPSIKGRKDPLSKVVRQGYVTYSFLQDQSIHQRSSGLDHLQFSTRSDPFIKVRQGYVTYSFLQDQTLHQRSSGIDPPRNVVRARSLTVFNTIRPSIKVCQGYVTYSFLQDQTLYRRSSGLNHLQFFVTRSDPLSKVVRARSLSVFYKIRPAIKGRQG